MSDQEERSDGRPNHPANSWFPKDSFWLARASKPSNLIFETPANLWEACIEYFNWARDNPLYAAETVKYMGSATIKAVPKKRLITVGGLCIFLGVARKTWYNYREREGYDVVCEQVEDIIKHQNIEGAAGDFFNANIIARLLGLVDKQNVEQNTTVKGGMKWTIEIVDPDPSKE